MTYIPPKEQLCGLSLNVAELFGKPHIGAHYITNGKVYSLDAYAACTVCGNRATNSHHIVPRGKAKRFALRTEDEDFVLHSPLFAVCGSGTTGCHNDFHGGAKYEIEWHWLTDHFAELWWSGYLLKRFPPHSPELYRFGYWVIRSRITGGTLTFNGVDFCEESSFRGAR